jgi:succinylglutamate desuccinylase
MSPFKKILIFGGTHGNEWTGVTVVRHYQDYFQKKFPQLSLEFIHANPEAYKLNKRFKDEDLNRAFQFLGERRESYEHHRALELKKMIEAEACLVIDLHTTTSNMGKTIILSDLNSFNLGLASQILQKVPEARIIAAPDPNKKYLASQSPYNLMIEVGPVPNGIIGAQALKETLLLLEAILSELTADSRPQKGQIEVYEEVENVYYPQSEKGEISAFIHSEFQGKDFISVNGKYSSFETFEGINLTHETRDIRYPIFINEAAYYPERMAYTLCQKRVLTF